MDQRRGGGRVTDPSPAISLMLSNHDPDERLGPTEDGEEALAEIIEEQFVRGLVGRDVTGLCEPEPGGCDQLWSLTLAGKHGRRSTGQVESGTPGRSVIDHDGGLLSVRGNCRVPGDSDRKRSQAWQCRYQRFSAGPD
ncbi:hypothetical protein [Nocardiopsis sp. YSL2]|uniref:hypothetical protein n=1 Tax=Nocardiopsis sp. YSL2 TaxID=2939492 RepID=UPI0026F445C8|nr:hypothetical protein [Nocardiopsis sp. YSL2]